MHLGRPKTVPSGGRVRRRLAVLRVGREQRDEVGALVEGVHPPVGPVAEHDAHAAAGLAGDSAVSRNAARRIGQPIVL